MKSKKSFKTNINCSGCISKVGPFLDAVVGSGKWNVDTMNRDKILTIESNAVNENEIIKTVQEAGFKIESMHN